MSPGVPSRAAELGRDVNRLAAELHSALDDAAVHDARGRIGDAASSAAIAQAAATGLLAAQVGRLADAIAADSAPLLPLPSAPHVEATR